MRTLIARLLALALTVPLSAGLSACITMGAQAAGSSESGNSSAASGESSGQSAGSSDGSGNSSDASAQNSTAGTTEGSSQNGGQSSLVASGSGTLVATLAGIGATIYAIKVDADRRAQQAQVALLYLRANGDQLKQDLALGAGPTLQDLAGAAQIRREQLGRFAQVMQRNRRELLSLAERGALTAERAVAFLETVGQLVLSDPLLREDGERWAAEFDG